jgi:hypothetical protein
MEERPKAMATCSPGRSPALPLEKQAFDQSNDIAERYYQPPKTSTGPRLKVSANQGHGLLYARRVLLSQVVK